MKRVFFILIILLTSIIYLTANNSRDSLLTELDKVLADGEYYTRQKEHRIDRLKMQLKQEISTEKQYELCYNIIEEYKSYISDSALVYINDNLRRAAENKQTIWGIQTNLQYSFVLSSSGLFVESKDIMEHIDEKHLTGKLWVEYYKCMEMLYVNIEIYQTGKGIYSHLPERIRTYRDSILYYLPENSSERLFYKFLIVNSEGDYTEALTYLETYLATLYPGTHEYAKKNYSMAILYQHLNNSDLQVKHLILAVISDVKDAVKEDRALLDLSIWLYEHNNIERAFNYIQYALNDANFYNARFRFFEISKALPIITSAYHQLNVRQNQTMKVVLLVFTVLFIALFVLLIYLQRQMAALSLARKGLRQTNRELGEMNDKLNNLNRKLSEANLIKEEYVGYFLDLCSGYIANLEDFRKMVNNKITVKRFDELLRMTSSSSEKGNEIKGLYASFDKALLKIYPGFVSSLNGLLKKDYRFDIRKGDSLNTELRVFALIRLGITDSSKIASFLRCSVQTVYNYRSKIKRSNLHEAMDIEEQIKKIGLLNIATPPARL
jgi:cell division protein FtsB